MDEARPMEHDPHTPAPATGHEERDITFRPIIIAGVSFFVLTAIIFVLIWLLFSYYEVREAKTSPAANPLAGRLSRQEPPEPRLQPDPEKDLAILHSEENALLDRYAWVDRAHGIVRIPIDRAITLLAERGLPAASGNAVAPEPPRAAAPEGQAPEANPAPSTAAQNTASDPNKEGQGN